MEGEHLAQSNPTLFRRAVQCVRMMALTPTMHPLLVRSKLDDCTPLPDILREQVC